MKITVLTGGMGQAVNPFERMLTSWHDDMPESYVNPDWQSFKQANPPYPIINPGLAKEGETVSGSLVWQHMFYEQQGWITGPVHENAQQERQAFLIDDTPKEGEKKLTDFDQSVEPSKGITDSYTLVNPDVDDNDQPTEAKPFDAVRPKINSYTVLEANNGVEGYNEGTAFVIGDVDEREEKEYILCAALHYDDDKEHEDQPQGIMYGFVISGRRHSDCYKTIELLTGDGNLGDTIGRDHQGFITNTNRYVNRKEGWRIAIAANQVAFGPTQTDENSILISENLY